MTTKIMSIPPSATEKRERPARRYRGKSSTASALTVLPVAPTPVALFETLTKSLPPVATPALGDDLTETAAKMIAWPVELWLNALYRGYEIALAANGITQGASRKLESAVLKNKLAPLPGLWSWPAAASSRKDW
ncbi:hypothetical protein VZ95_06005 [Elstera litoralis]|uniref:Uncharacterized protein n=1 Tax=Elstera litoralis TaxID=552518 RepID=A0A0F3IUI2_9PROT|nr:hypothetical protein [Elstera litoralis]KJV10282.1 hypothetical protein VZ95_06005 [Elstera litoralis]